MDKQKGLIVGTIIGSAVGATVAVLTTPKSGPELRDDINEQFENGKNSAEEVASLLKEKIESFTEIIDGRSAEISKTVVEEANHILNESKKALEEIQRKDDLDAKELRKIVKSIMREELKSGKEIGKVVKEEMKDVQTQLNKELEAVVKKIS
jgi:gas vesicle protein